MIEDREENKPKAIKGPPEDGSAGSAESSKYWRKIKKSLENINKFVPQFKTNGLFHSV